MRVHENGIAVVPEEPVKPVLGWFGEFGADEGEEEGVFGPEAGEHAFA